MSYPSLPLELIGYTLGFLHASHGTETDYVTLQCCSLALSPWGLAALADAWLYREIRVYTRPEHETKSMHGLSAMEFGVLLTGGLNATSDKTLDKAVGRYIQFLTIILPSPTSLELFAHRPLGDAAIAPFLSLGASIPLPALRSITLTTTGDRTVSWRNFDDDFQRKFVLRLVWIGDLAGRGAVEEVKFERINGFPVRVLERCPGLRRIHLEGNFELSPQSTVKTVRSRANLRYLSIRHCSASLAGIADWLTEANSMASNLRSLDFRSYQEEPVGFSLLPKILRECQETLEELTLDWGINLFCSAMAATSSRIPCRSRVVSSGTNPLFKTCLPLQTLPALKKLILYTTVITMTRAQPLIGHPGRHITVRQRQYQTSFREIGDALRAIWVGANSEAHRNIAFLSEIELKLAVERRGEGAPTMANVDFEPLLNALPQASPSPAITPTRLSQGIPSAPKASPLSEPPRLSPLITLNVTSAQKWTTWLHASAIISDIPFDVILADLKKNASLKSSIENGRVRLVVGL